MQQIHILMAPIWGWNKPFQAKKHENTQKIGGNCLIIHRFKLLALHTVFLVYKYCIDKHVYK